MENRPDVERFLMAGWLVLTQSVFVLAFVVECL